MSILWIPPADLRNVADHCRCGAKLPATVNIADHCRCGAKLPATVIIDADVTCHECAEAKLRERP